MQEWAIGVESWVIQDGNYPDFERGQQAAFAVEFYFEDPPHKASRRPSIELIGGSTYSLSAVVARLWDKAWMIDCGILAFRELWPPEVVAPVGVAAGDMITGRVSLGIDPYFYVEHLHKLPGMPPLIYTWRINRISLETTPWIEVGWRELRRDSERESYIDVERTDAWHDDDGRASYVLHCTLLDVPPHYP